MATGGSPPPSTVRGPSKPPRIVTQPVRRLIVEPGTSGSSLSVQATGSGLQYQWCKRVRDDPSAPLKAEEQIFHNYSQQFSELASADSLSIALYRAHLITKRQLEELIQDVPGNTNSRKLECLQLWLPSSSSHFLEKLISCLRERKDDMGHLELADTYERALWVPLSDQHLHYDGVTNSTLVLCSVGESHEGMYCCRVSSDSGDSILSEAAHVEMIKPDDGAVDAFVSELLANPSNGAELAQTLISRIQPGSSVGYYALAQAIKRCGECKEVVRAFLASGWSPSEPVKDLCGKTLVHILAEEGHTGTLMLVLKGSPSDLAKATDEDRSTPLHLAVKEGRLETVKTLLETTAAQQTINYQDNEFRTALHLAVELGTMEMVETLLAVPNINIGVLNKENMKAAEIAKKNGFYSISCILEEKERGDVPRSPLEFIGQMIGRSNSYDSNLHRTSSQVSQTSSGYASSVGGSTLRSLARTGSLQWLTADREMMELQRRLASYSGTLIGKRLIRQGSLKKCNRRGHKNDVHIFLFNDVMLYTKIDITRRYSVKEELSVLGMEVVSVQESGQPVVRNEPLSFTVKSRQRALHLVANSPEDKEDWIQAIQTTISHLRATQGHLSTPVQLLPGAGMGATAPVWVPDTHVTACQLVGCNRRFTPFERKHHCRQCGQVVCNACSTKRHYLIYLQKEGRVCDKCVEDFSGHNSSDVDSRDQREGSEEISGESSMSGYVWRVSGRRTEDKFYRLVGNVIYVYGAHEDTSRTHSIILIGYSVQGDQGSYKITLTHHQGKEELNESFISKAEDYERWLNAIKSIIRP